jgi:mono/diheme cytochrome c family protein
MRITLLLLISLAHFAYSADGKVEIDFLRVIKPILESSCIKCHGADRSHGELRLDTRELAFGAGDHGAIVTPGKPERSTLYTTSVLPDDDPLAMPPRDRDMLSKEQCEALKEWIKQGAKWPEGVELKRIDKVSFTVVGPILQSNCLQCHREGRAEGGLRLDSREQLTKGGTKGKVVVPYDSAASTLYTSLVTPCIHDKNRPRLLSDNDVENLRAWIDQGAVWPEDMELTVPLSAKTDRK